MITEDKAILFPSRLLTLLEKAEWGSDWMISALSINTVYNRLATQHCKHEVSRILQRSRVSSDVWIYLK